MNGMQLSNRVELAHSLHGQVMLGVLVSAQAIVRIKDERLYEELGCETFDDYLSSMAPMSRTQFYLCQKVVRKLGPYLAPKSADSALLTDGKSSENIGLPNSISSLEAISRLDEEDIEELVSGGYITTEDGKDVSLQDIRDMKSREAIETLRQFRLYKQRADETIKKHKSEANHYKSESESKDLYVENMRILEQTWGKPASTFEAKSEILERCRKALSLIDQLLVKVGIDEEDPQSLRSDLRDFLGRLVESRRRAYYRYADVMLQFEDELMDYKDPDPLKRLFGEKKEDPKEVKGVIYQDLEAMAIRCKPADSVGDKDWRLLESFRTRDELETRAAELRLEGYIEWESRRHTDEGKGLIRIDESRMAIKIKSTNGVYAHGWKNLENGFESVEAMKERLAELVQEGYVED